ncbi:MAG: hypothetical protein MI867_27095 [Pseudomonadales bacterium]|nr:hypothetical protein [Pseudomonadales bacterium]
MELLTNHDVFWVFPIEEALKQEVRQLSRDLHLNKDALDTAAQRKHLVHALNAIIDAGFEFYYDKPTSDDDRLSPMVRRTVNSIIKTVRGAIHLVVQRVFKNIPRNDLKLLAYYLDSMILTSAEREGQTYLAFPLEMSIREDLYKVMEKVNGSDSMHHYGEDLAAVLNDIIASSTHYYYHFPTEFVALGGFVKKAADVGIDSTVKGVQRIVRRILKDIDHDDVALMFGNLEYLVLTMDVPHKVCVAEYPVHKSGETVPATP